MVGGKTAPASNAPAVLLEEVQSGNIWRLSIALALAGANSLVVYAAGAVVGDMLAMLAVICGHSQRSANLGMQWHVIAIYAHSFFTGRLISRFGAGGVVGQMAVRASYP